MHQHFSFTGEKSTWVVSDNGDTCLRLNFSGRRGLCTSKQNTKGSGGVLSLSFSSSCDSSVVRVTRRSSSYNLKLTPKETRRLCCHWVLLNPGKTCVPLVLKLNGENFVGM